MCGIIGYYCFGDARPSLTELTSLFLMAQIRGTDATGMGWIQHGDLRIIKSPGPASRFVPHIQEAFPEELPAALIGHTRAATSGKPEHNVNNHPVFNKAGLAIVHNGIVHADHTLTRARDGEVDSEMILHVMEQGATWEARLKLIEARMWGSFAVAALDTQQPGTLCLFRHESPLVLYGDPTRDILFFGSTTEIVTVVAPTWRGLPAPATGVLWVIPDDTAVIVTKQRVIRRDLEMPITSLWHAPRRGHASIHAMDDCAACGTPVPPGEYLCRMCQLEGEVCAYCREEVDDPVITGAHGEVLCRDCAAYLKGEE